MAITKDLILEILEEVKGESKEIVAAIRGARGIIAIAKELFRIVPEVVEKVEIISEKLGIKGADKKALAIEILNALIPWPWWIPDGIRMALLDGAIEMAVAIFNRAWKKSA